MALFDFAWIPNIDNQLEDLATMAQPENWYYKHAENPGPNPILYNYFQHTFDRLEEQNRIGQNEDWACFNTGLVTPNQEEIIALFQENRIIGRQPWFFKGFCRESDRALTRFARLGTHFLRKLGEVGGKALQG